MNSQVYISKFTAHAPTGVIEQVLEVKSQRLLAHPDDASQHPGGFLVGTLDQEQISAFLREGGRLYVASIDDQCAGYLLSTSIDEFFGYFSPDHQTETSKHQESAVFTPLAEHSDVLIRMQSDLFVYHVAVGRQFSRLRVGSLLMEKLFLDSPGKGFIADILTEPIHNGASMAFFKKHGFEDVGTIDYFGYKGFGDLKTRVLRRSETRR